MILLCVFIIVRSLDSDISFPLWRRILFAQTLPDSVKSQDLSPLIVRKHCFPSFFCMISITLSSDKVVLELLLLVHVNFINLIVSFLVRYHQQSLLQCFMPISLHFLHNERYLSLPLFFHLSWLKEKLPLHRLSFITGSNLVMIDPSIVVLSCLSQFPLSLYQNGINTI